MVKALGLGRSTIREYRLRIKELGFSFKEFATLTYDEIKRALRGEHELRMPERHTTLLTILDEIYKSYIEGQTNLKTVWIEYRQNHPDCYGYSQLTEHFHSWQKIGV
jgi:hypothetical protein